LSDWPFELHLARADSQDLLTLELPGFESRADSEHWRSFECRVAAEKGLAMAQACSLRLERTVVAVVRDPAQSSVRFYARGEAIGELVDGQLSGRPADLLPLLAPGQDADALHRELAWPSALPDGVLAFVPKGAPEAANRAGRKAELALAVETFQRVQQAEMNARLHWLRDHAELLGIDAAELASKADRESERELMSLAATSLRAAAGGRDEALLARASAGLVHLRRQEEANFRLLTARYGKVLGLEPRPEWQGSEARERPEGPGPDEALDPRGCAVLRTALGLPGTLTADPP
jgi:2-oxo-4-hydroxy-4-carboxy--5-ureidoimidazoline (OHCU) decarboxylase